MTRADRAPMLAVFARQPVAGRVKTRLEPALGAEAAARLADLLIQWTLSNVRSHWPGPVGLFVWPAESLSFFADRVDVPVFPQEGADLGERMLSVLGGAHERPRAVIGCDVPHVPEETLHMAFESLSLGRNVLGPALDGGFYLIGAGARFPAGVFDGIEWGGAQVRHRLLDNAARMGLVFDEVTTLRDLDTPEDLGVLSRQYAPLAEFLRDMQRVTA